MKIKTKNKKAQLGHGILWIYRIILLILVSLVYVLIIYNMFYFKCDIRSAETVLLAKKTTNCLTNNGILDVKNFDNAMLKNCFSFNKDQLNEYYISAKLSYNDFSDKIKVGNAELEVLCGLKGKSPECISQSYYILAKNNTELKNAKLDLSISILKVEENYMNI